jgi:hypothetical protein
MLGLDNDAPRAAPAVARGPDQVGKAPGRTAPGQTIGLRRGALFGERANQALVAGEAEDVIDRVRLAPRHPLVAGEARVGAQHDRDPRPACSDLADDSFDLGHRTG